MGACSERATAPTDLTSEVGAPIANSTGSGGSSNSCKKELTLDMQAFLETSGDVSVDIAIPDGLTVTKVSVKVYDAKGKHVGQFEFNKLNLSGNQRVVIPAKADVKAGWSANVTAHVKSCGGKETDIVRAGLIVQERNFDLSVVPILLADVNPVLDRALEDAQIGVPTLYDVTISNAGARAVDAGCTVTVDGNPVGAGAQYWVSGTGATIGIAGQPISIPAGGAQICRFSVTYATEGAHTLAVTTAAVGLTEANVANNSTSATINVAPPGHGALEHYEWHLMQQEAITSNADGTISSLGVLTQSARIQSYWDEDLSDVAGTDTWIITTTSSTAGLTFDSRSVNVIAPRFTRSRVAEATAGGTTACEILVPSSTSPTRAYLHSSIDVCAVPKDGDPGKVTIRLTYIVSFGADVPYNGSDVLLWGPTFSYLADVQHIGASTTTTVGGVVQTVDLGTRTDVASGVRLAAF